MNGVNLKMLSLFQTASLESMAMGYCQIKRLVVHPNWSTWKVWILWLVFPSALGPCENMNLCFSWHLPKTHKPKPTCRSDWSITLQGPVGEQWWLHKPTSLRILTPQNWLSDWKSSPQVAGKCDFEKTSWWFNQPIWFNICSSKWSSSTKFRGVNSGFTTYIETQPRLSTPPPCN